MIYKRTISAMTALSVLLSSLLMPMHAYASDRTAHTINPYADPYSYVSSPYQDPLVRAECGRTPTNKCEWQHLVPLDHWEEVASLYNPRGEDGLADGRQFYEGERWMALGIEAAGILGLNSADIVYKTMQQQVAQPPWVIARYLAEKAELRVHAVKVIKTSDGYQRVLVADYTPDHGRWHEVWRHFLKEDEKRFVDNKGINPFANFTRGINTKTFVNVSPGAAQAIMGQAMMHHGAPFGLFIEPQLRLHQWQTKSGNALKRKITTHTQGFAKPNIFLAAPMSMTAGRNSPDPRMMGMYCPRNTGCTHPDEIVYAGFVLDHVYGGNIPAIEDQLFYTQETKSSWTVAFFALMTAALTWGIGAMAAGSGSWAYAAGQGFLPAAAAPAGAMAAGTITASVGLLYGGLNVLGQGGSLTSPQRGWFESTGWDPRSITNGTLTGATSGNHHAQRLYNEASTRHIQSGNPGTAQSGGNLSGTTMIVQGNCPLDWGREQCEDAGLDPGMAPRKDMHTNRALNSSDYTRKVKACTDAGYGYDQKILYYCLATAVFIDKRKQE